MMMINSQIVDIFPSVLSSDVYRLIHPEDKKGFRGIYDQRHPMIAKFYLDKDKIYFRLTSDWSNNKLVDNFIRSGQDSSVVNEFRPDHVSWDNVGKRLKLNLTGKRNTDVRTSFVYDGNTYLGKSYFTFGLKTVAPGTRHIYQTTKVPLLIYFLRGRGKSVLKTDRAFRPIDRGCFDRFVFVPNSAYAVEEGEMYLVMCVQKTLFSVHVVHNSCHVDLGKPLLNPRSSTHWGEEDRAQQVDPYARPPQTPHMDNLHNNSDDVLMMPPPPPPPPSFTPQQQQYYVLIQQPLFDEQHNPDSIRSDEQHNPDSIQSFNNPDSMPPPPPPPSCNPESIPDPERSSCSPDVPFSSDEEQEFVPPPYVPLEKNEYMCPPDFPTWYGKTFRWETKEAPPALGSFPPCEEEPMDLTVDPKPCDTYPEPCDTGFLDLSIFSPYGDWKSINTPKFETPIF